MLTDRFVALDFETANPDLASICQVGLVTFEAGKITETWSSLVNPEDYFDGMNVAIHGIDGDAVKDAPTLPHIYDALRARLTGQVVVSHTPFDRTALAQATDKYRLTAPPCQWLDSARVVRRAWTQWSRKGYGLSAVCSALGITYEAHNALEDARAAGLVLLRAIEATGLRLQDWMARVEKSIDPTKSTSSSSIALEGNPDGPLAGEEIVFTGALNVPRREAAALAVKVGCDVAPNVRKTTTILVVGDQDVRRLSGHEKSTKHRKAEELIAQGHQLRILAERDFVRLVELYCLI